MLRHSIYSVRDKKKVDAEVIDIREIESAKGVRFQIVGIHPEDGTTVTTFCSALVADDYRQKLDAIPQEMSAENVVLAQDHIPKSEATVVSTDGTPVEDDLETFVEDPLVGSPSEGTLTSAKVMAAEGESEKKNCGFGQDPCKTFGAESFNMDSIDQEIKELESGDDVDGITPEYVLKLLKEIKRLNQKNEEKSAETVAGIDVQTPSQIAIETPDSDELIVPDPDLLVNGDGRVLGQQTGKVNTTPMHAEENPNDCQDKLDALLKEHEDHPDYDDLESFAVGSETEHDDPCQQLEHARDWVEKHGHRMEADYEYYEAPGLAGNKRVLIPTAVIGGLALAYLAKPELLSGSFDKISEMLGKMTKKGDKTE